MATPAPRRFVAGILSMLVPGAGQLYSGARRRGLLLFALAAGVLLALLALASRAAVPDVDRKLVATLLALDVALLAFRLFAVLDVARGARAAGLVVLVALTAAPHVAAGYVTVRGYAVLERVFTSEENSPHDHALFLTDLPPLPS